MAKRLKSCVDGCTIKSIALKTAIMMPPLLLQKTCKTKAIYGKA